MGPTNSTAKKRKAVDLNESSAGQTNSSSNDGAPQTLNSNSKIVKDSLGQSPTLEPNVSSSVESTEFPQDPDSTALEKLEQIHQCLTNFNQQVDVFTGSTRNDRVYKQLDEQAVKIMMRCDELVDVSADIKERRKEMIRNVQTVLAKLESKVPTISVEDNCSSIEPSSNDHEQNIDSVRNSSIKSEDQQLSTTTVEH